ncbi:MAG: ABC transporter substrate-binding protein [Gemmatimonadales bacterium]
MLALGVLPSCGGSSDAIRIGVAGPFSQPRGESMRLAAELAVREINAAGGVRGRPLALVLLDDSASTQRAIQVARQFYDMPDVYAVVGHLTSGTTIAAAPVYNGGATPLLEISPSASSPTATHGAPYTFRVCPTDLLHGARLAAWARRQLAAERAAVLYLNDEYGRGVRQVFTSSFTSLGGRVITDDPYLPDLPSFRPYLERLQRAGGAQVMMVAGTRAGAEAIMSAMRAAGVTAQVMGGDGLTGLETDGTLISSAYLPDRPGERNAAFVAAYRRAYDSRLPDHRGAGAYDIIHLLARGLDAVGPHRGRLRDWVAGVGTEIPAFEGVTGTIAFDENGDVPNKDVVVGVVRGGQLVTATP